MKKPIAVLLTLILLFLSAPGVSALTAADTAAAPQGVSDGDVYELPLIPAQPATVPQPEPMLASPVITSLKLTTQGVAVSWDPVSEAEKYRVFRKEVGGSWKKLADTTAVTLTDQKATSGKTYAYTVRCISADGEQYTSDYDTNGKSVKYIAAPKVKSASNAYKGVLIKWTKSAGAAKYRVFRKESGGSWKKLADTTAVTLTDQKAVSGKTYAYTVRCITKDGKQYTSAYDTNGKSVKYIAAPAIKSVTNSGLKITIRWNKVAGAEMYRVFYRSKGGKWKTLGTTASASLSYNHAAKSSTEYYTVRCMNKAKTAYTSAFDDVGYSFTLTVTSSDSSSSSGGYSSGSSGSSTAQASSYYVGSSKSDVYHRPSCASAKKIKSSNLVRFSSAAEARQHGYHACKVCKP